MTEKSHQIRLKECGYQLKIKKENQKYIVIKTYLGCFKYRRLSFGIKIALALFQGYISELLKEEKGVLYHRDDLIIHSKDNAEFKERVDKVLQIL